MAFFQLAEVKDPWSPPKNSYPTWNDVLRMYLSRTMVKGIGASRQKKMKSPDALREIAQFLHDVWESGDGLPKSERHIIIQIHKELLPKYHSYRVGEGRKKGKKRKKKTDEDVRKEPKRRSSRLGGASIPAETEKMNVEQSAGGVDSEKTPCRQNTPRTTRNQTSSNEYKNEWMEDFGCKLFDIRSPKKFKLFVNDQKNKLNMTFDSLFYEDQQKPPELREKTIEYMRVTKEYFAEQREKQLHEARIYNRRIAAHRISFEAEKCDDEDDEPLSQDEIDEEEFVPASHVLPRSIVSSVERRSISGRVSEPKTFVSEFFIPYEKLDLIYEVKKVKSDN